VTDPDLLQRIAAALRPEDLLDSPAVATAAAFAFKHRGEERVALAYRPGAPTGRDGFDEAVDLAAELRLPCVFVVDHTPAARVPRPRVLRLTVDGGDPFAVYEATRRAVRRARAGQGPTVVEAMPPPPG
jgi:pyruvate dehydrogenase E1 component alpha subunit